MANTIQIRRATAAAFTAANTLLAAGEFAYETDTGKVKLGDGSTAWGSLGYKVDVVFTSAQSTKLSGIATGATANDTDANLKNRANHTGTQSADTITDGTTNKAYTAAEQTKLGGIEAGADVTDATNVAAAGAVMESDTSTASMSFVIDEDNMASDSATKVPTQQSVKAYVDNTVGGVTGGLDFKGVTDCSTNPNYPAGLVGDFYKVSVAGKIGGASGKIVEIGDSYMCTEDNAGGNEATVGTKWYAIQGNIEDATAFVTKALFNANTILIATADDTPTALTVNASTVVGRKATGDIVALTAAELRTILNVEDGADVTDATNVDAAGAVMTADTSLSGYGFFLDEDNMASDSAVKVPSQQSVKAYVDNKTIDGGAA